MYKKLLTFILVIFITAPLSLRAEDENFAVYDLAIDEVGVSAEKARKDGIEKVQKQAFETILDRLGITNINIVLGADESEEGKQRSQNVVTISEVNNLIKSLEVKDERIASHRYRAQVNIVFNPEHTKYFLENITEVKNAKILNALVIPIFDRNGEVLLWEKENVWREVWENIGGDDFDKLSFKFAFGDLNDIADIAAILENDNGEVISDQIKSQFQDLLKRYNAEKLIFIKASFYSHIESDRTNLNVAAEVIDEKGDFALSEAALINYIGNSSEDINFILENASIESAKKLKGFLLQGEELVEEEVSSHQQLVLRVGSISEWIDIKKQLDSIEELKSKFKIKYITSHQIDVIFETDIETESLQKILNSKLDLRSEVKGNRIYAVAN